jgi:hypothetical protein
VLAIKTIKLADKTGQQARTISARFHAIGRHELVSFASSKSHLTVTGGH